MNVRLILQARLSSSRLPGKMLLPVGGVPLVVLCAKRAMSSGLSIVVAISDQTSDDPLAHVLGQHEIQYMRGDLDNVLGRFMTASDDMGDDDLVVRLTGDNPFVDGRFIDDVLEFHQAHGEEYTRTLSPQDGFPYGLSAEVVKVGSLRRIASSNPSDVEKEHVTFALTQSGEYTLYSNEKSDLSHLRVTVDTFEDYLRVCRVFDGINQDVLSVGWQDLIEELQGMSDTPNVRVPHMLVDGYNAKSTLALGTAQLGMSYGIANKAGQPNLEAAREIVSAALRHGIQSFDTAAAYGRSEAVLGEVVPKDMRSDIHLVTKLDPLPALDTKNISQSEVRALVQNSVYRSLHRLGVSTIPTFLLHRWSHYTAHDGVVWDALLDFKNRNIISRIGVSVQNQSEAMEAITSLDISYIQIPANILDRRWERCGFVEAVAQRADVHIQIRSALLQGLCLLPPKEWPLPEEVSGQIVKSLNECVIKYGRQSIADLCYAYVRSLSWASDIVVGVETYAQLMNNITLFNTPLFSKHDMHEIESVFSDIPDELLNPALWSR